MPKTSKDTGFAKALEDAWDAELADPQRPEQNTSRQSWPTRTGPLRPTTTANTEGVG